MLDEKSSCSGVPSEHSKDIQIHLRATVRVKSKQQMATSSKTLEQKYQKLSQKQHVLQLPDTYIGSVEPTTEPRYVLTEDRTAMHCRDVTFVPGLLKITDEILVNARDQKIRDPNLKHIKVDVDKTEGTVAVLNDGLGLDAAVHRDHGVHIPELIFGHLLTSTNYDQEEKRIVGGKNGCKGPPTPCCHSLSSEDVPLYSEDSSGILSAQSLLICSAAHLCMCLPQRITRPIS